MSIARKAFKGATWLAMFKFISQTFSWVITLMIARILLPDDYGLMAMATIIIGLGLMFSELGLGAAIIQRPEIDHSELSSIFWFTVAMAIVLSVLAFFSSYLLAYVFNEPRVIPLTKVVSVIFLINGLQIVPLNLLKKRLDFKRVGLIEMIAVIVSSSFMIVIARLGGGVWTLISGFIIQSSAKLVLIYSSTMWFPSLHFNFRQVKSYLTFGATVSLGGIFFYVSQQSDKFFAGRVWMPKTLGFYSFALQLAQIPTEKIVVLINQVSFSALSELQNSKHEFNKFYLDIIKITATLVLPIFIGGYLVGEDLVRVLLDEKWVPIIFVFKYLCLTQIITSINAVNSYVHYAQSRPQWSLCFHAMCAVLMAVSFYFAVPYGLNAILIPWFTTYVVICTVWIVITLSKIEITVPVYVKNLINPIFATVFMAIGILLCEYLSKSYKLMNSNLIIILITKICIGALIYISYLWFFDRKLFYNLKKLRNP